MQIAEHKIAQKNNIVLLGKVGLNKFLQSRKSENPKDSPLYIPTGVFVQSLEFEDANDVFIKGYIWQKYDNNIPQNVSREYRGESL